jgi:hypothetical protein
VDHHPIVWGSDPMCRGEFLCSVCLLEFDNVDRRPVVWGSCGHSVCQTCLCELLRNACVTCQMAFDPTKNMNVSIQCNPHVQALLKPLPICNGCDQFATVYCKHEDSHYCDECDNMVHSTLQKFKLHERVGAYESPMSALDCSEHKDEGVKFYCSTCSKAILLGTHSKHFLGGAVEKLDQMETRFQSSLILSETQSIQLMSWLALSCKSKSRLLYRGSEHGFQASQFHNHCDGKGATITVVRSTSNHIFGGYTSKSWSSTSEFIMDNESWLYTLTHNGPAQFKAKPNNPNHVYGYSSYGPTFGSGHDLYIGDACDANSSSHNNGNYSFLVQGKGEYHLCGTYQFEVSEIEVFQVI